MERNRLERIHARMLELEEELDKLWNWEPEQRHVVFREATADILMLASELVLEREEKSRWFHHGA